MDKIKITEPSITFCLNEFFREDMNEDELYEYTRGYWIVNVNRAEQAEYAFAVYEGTIKEVYKINRWHRAGTTPYYIREDKPTSSGRWEFTEKIAEDEIRTKYIGKSVQHYFRRGAANPVKYVNC